MKLEFSGPDFQKKKKHSNVTFHENSSSLEPSFPMRTERWTDRLTGRHDEADSCLSQISEYA